MRFYLTHLHDLELEKSVTTVILYQYFIKGEFQKCKTDEKHFILNILDYIEML